MNFLLDFVVRCTVTVNQILFTAEIAETAEYENTIFIEFMFSLRSLR